MGRYIGFIVLWQAGGVGVCCEDVTLVSIVVGGQLRANVIRSVALSALLSHSDASLLIKKLPQSKILPFKTTKMQTRIRHNTTNLKCTRYTFAPNGGCLLTGARKHMKL